ncbi:MAG: MFS transporter [Candidatus Kapaibacteriota bacterium]
MKFQWQNTFRSLKYRNFQLYFYGQTISLIGTWIQRIATPWLVYDLTHSVFLLGLVGFLGQLPTFFIAPFSGVYVDRLSKYKLLILTQVIAMLQALILAILFMTHNLQIWHIILLSVILGVVNAFDTPARQSFLIEIIEKKEDLGNAIALNSSMVNIARLIGPSIAGILIATTGEGMCFLINALSYIFVIISLFLMKFKEQKIGTSKKKDLFKEMKEGWDYSLNYLPIKSVLILLTIVSLMGMPYTVLIPDFAKIYLKGNSNVFGFLMGASGAGAFIGAIYLASRKSIAGLESIIYRSSIFFGAGIIALSLSRNIYLSIILMMLTGLGMMLQIATSNTIIQTLVQNEKRGRVMSLYTMAFMGTAPFGSLIAGTFAKQIGTPNTLIISGISCIFAGLYYATKLPQIKKDIYPQVRDLELDALQSKEILDSDN